MHALLIIINKINFIQMYRYTIRKTYNNLGFLKIIISIIRNVSE